MKKGYNPVPLKETDKRIFLLRFSGGFRHVETSINQLDVLQIMSHLQGRNDRLHGQLKRFIIACDEDTHVKTEFVRKLPRRRMHE